MANWKRTLLTSTLVISITAPGVIQAQTNATMSTGISSTVKASEADHHDQKKKHGGRHHALWAHRQMYMTLLAEKYDPSSVNEWKTAFAERKRLIEQLKALRSVEKEKSEEQEERSDKEKANATDKGGWRTLREKFKQNHQEFTEAIIAEDANKIKAVLPKLLDEVKTVNKRLAEKLEKKTQ